MKSLCSVRPLRPECRNTPTSFVIWVDNMYSEKVAWVVEQVVLNIHIFIARLYH